MDCVRITIPSGSVWRACVCCGRLAAMPPDAVDCPTCSVQAVSGMVERAVNELLYAIEHRDGAWALRVLDRVRREASAVIADGMLRSLVVSGRLTVAGR
jgi:hypothetical protein